MCRSGGVEVKFFLTIGTSISTTKKAAFEEFDRISSEGRARGVNVEKGVPVGHLYKEYRAPKVLQGCPVVLRVPSLYLLDQDKDGRVGREELDSFIVYVHAQERQMRARRSQDWMSDGRSRFRALFLVDLGKTLSERREGGELLDWFDNVVEEMGGLLVRNGLSFVPRATIDTLHALLEVRDQFGYSAAAFFNLLQLAGEEMNLLPLGDEELDDYVPFPTLEALLRNYSRSLFQLYRKIAPEQPD